MNTAALPQLLVVMGGSGRLGTALLPHLTSTTALVAGVSRTRPSHQASNLRWQVLDVTDAQAVDSATPSLAEASARCSNVVLVDLLLDRSTVTAMRRSVEAGPRFADLLNGRIAQYNHKLSLVVASTTAVLAPWALQTPYGLAKRRQLRHYATSGLSGAAMLLPQLAPDNWKNAQAAPVWTFGQAAQRIAELAIHVRDQPQFTVHVPPESPPPAQRLERQLIRDVQHTLGCWAQRLVEPDSPHTHRHATHALLNLLPSTLRRHVDHHGAPAALVRHLESSVEASVVRDPPA